MKMKQKRALEKNKPVYKHTCNCMMQEYEIINELPKISNCVNSKFYKKEGSRWIDVTDQVEQRKYF